MKTAPPIAASSYVLSAAPRTQLPSASRLRAGRVCRSHQPRQLRSLPSAPSAATQPSHSWRSRQSDAKVKASGLYRKGIDSSAKPIT